MRAISRVEPQAKGKQGYLVTALSEPVSDDVAGAACPAPNLDLSVNRASGRECFKIQKGL